MPPSRIDELRRRVQSDPASIAFAQLAEEYRRSGQTDEAVRVCREGLTRHPGYLSARVTLGRALLDLGRLSDAQGELEFVVAEAPENLAAVRGLAEIFQRGGNLPEALNFFRRALTLARHDPEIEEIVQQLSRQVGVAASGSSQGLTFEEAHRELLSAPERVPAAAAPAAARAVETTTPAPAHGATAPFDFDRLVAALGAPAAPAQLEAAVQGQPPVTAADLPAVADDSSNPFAELEAELRAREEGVEAPAGAALPGLPDLPAWVAAASDLTPLVPSDQPDADQGPRSPDVELEQAFATFEPTVQQASPAANMGPDWSGLFDLGSGPISPAAEPPTAGVEATRPPTEDVLGELEDWLSTLHDRSNV